MHEQLGASFLHHFQHGVNVLNACDPFVAVRGGPLWVELTSHHMTTLVSALNLDGCQGVGQIKRHQWLKVHPFGYACQDAFTVGQGLLGGCDRSGQVGHDDGARELLCSVGHDSRQGLSVAHMQVPVIGPGDGELGHGRRGQ